MKDLTLSKANIGKYFLASFPKHPEENIWVFRLERIESRGYAGIRNIVCPPESARNFPYGSSERYGVGHYWTSYKANTDLSSRYYGMEIRILNDFEALGYCL